MRLTLKNIALNFSYYGLTIVLFPWVILSIETLLGIGGQPLAIIRSVSIALAIAGASLQLCCIAIFQSTGGGTPSPAFAPTTLVTRGPYRWVRNPMNSGELMVFLALAGWFASPLLLGYAVLSFLAFHVFILTWEEPHHRNKFGEEYSQYCRRVNRWIPKSVNNQSPNPRGERREQPFPSIAASALHEQKSQGLLRTDSSEGR